MTLAQCLDEVRVSFLGGDTQRMSKVAKTLIADLKMKYYVNKEYPRQGWFISIDGRDISLFNKDFIIPLNLNSRVVNIRNYNFR